MLFYLNVIFHIQLFANKRNSCPIPNKCPSPISALPLATKSILQVSNTLNGSGSQKLVANFHLPHLKTLIVSTNNGFADNNLISFLKLK